MWANKELQAFYEHEFDFDNQTVDTYDRWLAAFDKAVVKRMDGKVFMGMSSGYDSGALSHNLVKQGADVKVYTMYNHENADIITERLKKIPNHQVCEMSPAEWQKYYDFLNGKINPKAMQDHASMGVAATFELAKSQGRTICISGQGGDETMSDYALFPAQSHFKGHWPDKLYEWPNFRGNMQLEYLNEIEDIALLYGIEVRYPFLDIELLQEWLWLTPALKNAHYKAPLYEYLTRNNIPFEENVKRGYNPVNRKDINR